MFLAFVAHYKQYLYETDIVTAFLQGNLEEEVFIEVEKRIDEIDPKPTACKLNHALNGLKQSPRTWNTTTDEYLTKNIYVRAVSSDPCFYVLFLN